MANNIPVAVIMASETDLPVMKPALEMLDEFDVPYELRVMSAHRSPDAVHEFARTAEERGLKVLIAGASGAAHLAGTLASLTTLPVIGIPMPTDRMGGMDSLLSTVQMPRGVPVATMGIGTSGAQNAALLAVQILALSDEQLRQALQGYRARLAESVKDAEEHVRKSLRGG